MMSWSYSGNPANSALDEARFILGDTDDKDPVLSDEELNFMINKYTDTAELYYNMFMQAVIQYSKAIKRTLGPQSEDPTSRVDFFTRMMNQYKQDMLLSTHAGLSLPMYQHPKVFFKGMNNNPVASKTARFP